MSSALRTMECPVCRCRMTIPQGYGRRTISCSSGHVIGLERPRRRRRWPLALAATALLVVIALAVSGWPLHLGVLQRFAG
jgi:hypothetical protein